MSQNDVLLVIDMLSKWDFDGAAEMIDDAESVVEKIGTLRDRLDSSATIAFANDDPGFHGSREWTYADALGGEHPELVEPLEPRPHEEFIHKGQHSAFYGTPLAHLLTVREARRVILTGQVTEQCVLYTALDAHVRGYEIIVVSDAVLAIDQRLGDAALEMIERNMHGRLMDVDEFLRVQSP